MSELSEILERLHTAWDSLESAQGTMRFWCDLQRTRRAYEAWQRGPAPGSVQVLRTRMADRDGASVTESIDDSGPKVTEEVFRFWAAKPWHWRIETLTIVQGAMASLRDVMVINGAVWWTWTANDVHTNARAAHPEQREHSGVDRALLVMLDPAPLLGTLRMQIEGSAEALGRHGDQVDGIVRNAQTDPGLWPGADQYRLLVDRQRGILLHAEALQAGVTYAETAFTDLAIDQAIPEERFVLEVPPGVRVHYHW